MAAPKGGISIDWQAMDPNSPAAELEVVGSLSPPFTPHPPAAASAHADSDDGGGEVEFANFTDQELGSKIRFWEGELQRGALRKTQDKGKKLRARVGRMKKEHERRSRIADRQKQVNKIWALRSHIGFESCVRMSDGFLLLTVRLAIWLHESCARCLMDFRVLGKNWVFLLLSAVVDYWMKKTRSS